MSAILCGPPCFKSVFGMPLQTAVYIISLVDLIIKVANVVKYSEYDRDHQDHRDHLYIGKIIVDGLYGILCSIFLFIGARMRNRCLLSFWIIIFLCERLKHLYVVIVKDPAVVNDWMIYEDWVSFSLLAFTFTYTLAYAAVTVVVIAFTKECGTNNGTNNGTNISGSDDYGAPPAYRA